MVDVGVLPAFVAVILLFLLPPGPDMAYMVAVGLEGGRGAALQAILGIGTGMAIYATGVVLGLGQLVHAYPGAVAGVKIAGAVYLMWLALTTVRAARRLSSSPSGPVNGRWYPRGFVVAATNPKIILFYLAVLPAFTGHAHNTTAQFALLGSVNVLCEVALYGTIGMIAGRFHTRFSSSTSGHTALKYIAGSVYLVLALVISTETMITQ